MYRFLGVLRRRWSPVPAGLIGGTSVVAVAGLVLVALVVVPVDGCDEGDSKAFAFVMAAFVGLLLNGWLLADVVRRERHDLRAVLGGVVAGLVPLAVFLVAGAARVSSLESGCPV
ncbi:hypothetical protein ACNAW0_02170 [Micromonospora sp. SL1-18]|uniref:hypothetical protein n=1 Tax=Micromonospora sp. SL1-18 TaxID=3399128 RepID=UPI003A4E6706